MTRVKRWFLKLPSIAPEDAMWIIGLNCRVSVTQKPVSVDTSRGSFHVAGRSEIIVTTTTQRQEDMLQLKYGSDMVLMSIVHVAAGNMYRDQYGILP